MAAEDPFIAKVLSLSPENNHALENECATALATARMPTTRNELFRYTDMTPLLRQTIAAPPVSISSEAVTSVVSSCVITAADSTRVVIVNGQYDTVLSNCSGLPASVYIGDVNGAPDHMKSSLNAQVSSRGGIFSMLNAAASASAVAVCVPAGVTVDVPIHVVYVSSGAAAADTYIASAPRLLVDVGEGASVEIIEEFVSIGDGCSGQYWVNAVLEASVATRGSLLHSYVEQEAPSAYHTKATLITQAEDSTYSMVECRMGGSISRCAPSTPLLFSKLNNYFFGHVDPENSF